MVAAVLGVALLGLCIANPFVLMFIVKKSVRNESGEFIRVQPYGVREGGGRALVRKFLSPIPLAVPGQEPWIELGPGEARAFHYDFDDINLCWLLVRGRAGPTRALHTGMPDARCPASGSKPRCCSTPAAEEFAVPQLQGLPTTTTLFGDAGVEVYPP